MVVPLPDLWHFCVESAHVLVEQVVAITATELVQRFCHLRNLRCDDVGPDLPSLSADRLGNRTIRINVVAAMNEEKGPPLTHGFVNLHPAEAGVDTPALSGRVPAP